MTVRNLGGGEWCERDSEGQWVVTENWESWWPEGSNVNLGSSLNSVFQTSGHNKI